MHWTISRPNTRKIPVHLLPVKRGSPMSNGSMTADHATTTRETIKADKELALGRRVIGEAPVPAREVAIKARAEPATVRGVGDEVASVDVVAAEDLTELIEGDEIVVAERASTTKPAALPMGRQAQHPNHKETLRTMPVLVQRAEKSLLARKAGLPSP